MPHFAANLTMMFDAAADAGFDAVEFLFPYEAPAEIVAERLRRNRLTVALFNLPPGDWAAGERGLASLPARLPDLKDGLSRGLEYAQATGVGRMHLMAGIAPADDVQAARAYRDAVRYCAERVGEHGLDLVLEPINGRDMPGYFLNDFGAASALIAELGRPNLKLQFDAYHRQIMHGDVVRAFAASLPIVGHVQAASVPSRNEPDGEELDYRFVFAELDRLGYDGFVGCEYRPRGRTEDGLGWFAPWRSVRGGDAR